MRMAWRSGVMRPPKLDGVVAPDGAQRARALLTVRRRGPSCWRYSELARFAPRYPPSSSA